MNQTSGKLVILEGPDGGGKTELAKAIVKRLNQRLNLVYQPGWPPAVYVHCGPFPRVSDGLARLYVEAMRPALDGLANVVMDRSWLSEQVYGPVYRGRSRLPPAFTAMLERVAMRCETVVVLCRPPINCCLDTYARRKGQEYLPGEELLRAVWAAYGGLNTDLPIVHYDYTIHGEERLTRALHTVSPTTPHPTTARSAGNLHAPFVLVGEAFGEVKNQDPLAAYPFVSFNNGGCSAWLSTELHKVVTEDQLLWANADFERDALRDLINYWRRQMVFALGDRAHSVLNDLGIHHTTVKHPQRAKRFLHRAPYELLKHLESP